MLWKLDLNCTWIPFEFHSKPTWLWISIAANALEARLEFHTNSIWILLDCQLKMLWKLDLNSAPTQGCPAHLSCGATVPEKLMFFILVLTNLIFWQFCKQTKKNLLWEVRCLLVLACEHLRAQDFKLKFSTHKNEMKSN